MESTKFGKKRGLAASGPKGKPQEDTMRFRILFSFLLTALFVLASSCGTTPNCPVCGTTKNGAYAVINVIPVPEHNNSGEPGGPFNSFDISTWRLIPPWRVITWIMFRTALALRCR